MALGTLAVTGDEVADALVNTEPLALLLAMLLDQQIPMEWAFKSPSRLAERLGGKLDAGAVAAMDPADLEAAFCAKPALHRFPAAMARRAHELCRHVAEQYDGNAGAVWGRAADSGDLYDRVRALPGYGEEKSMIFLAILAKRFAVRPDGWAAYAGPFADDTPRSVADIDGPEALARVRAWKKDQKAAGRSKQD
ncbi:MAG: Fe-S cluster assembly protein HesB [bacterium]|nr:Fe-S cluster assembly protein HesB [bacterium]